MALRYREFFLRFGAYLTLFFIAVLVTACSEENPTGKPISPQVYAIDPLFREFYNKLGGESILGAAISPLQENGDTQYQYTMDALLVYDPQNPQKRFHLASIGLDLGIGEPSVSQGSQPGAYYIGGHYVYKDFVNLFVQM